MSISQVLFFIRIKFLNAKCGDHAEMRLSYLFKISTSLK